MRGDATVTDFPCNAGVCPLEFAGTFRGAPVGTGAYTGSIKLNVNEAFPNGEGGVCAPIEGQFTLGAGTPDRLVLALYGDSCQDGAGDPRSSSFTGVAHFVVKSGTGTYAKTRGGGIASFSEDAADHDRMTLIRQHHALSAAADATLRRWASVASVPLLGSPCSSPRVAAAPCAASRCGPAGMRIMSSR